MSSSPIGIFDSGAGGLSILAGIHKHLPHESLLYVADTANAPYGPKGEDFVRARCQSLMQFFLEQNVKAVVVACNTATAAAIAQMRANYSIPIIGVEPAVKPAASQSGSRVVGVLATVGTISSEKFLTLQNRFNDAVTIVTNPCIGLVEEIEKINLDTVQLHVLLKQFISPMLKQGVDTLVLGCTHYSLIKPIIQNIAGPEIKIVDSGDAVARELQRRLQERDLLLANGKGCVDFFTSGNLEMQNALLGRFWGSEVSVKPLPGFVLA